MLPGLNDVIGRAGREVYICSQGMGGVIVGIAEN